jgi:hypothetical protein
MSATAWDASKAVKFQEDQVFGINSNKAQLHCQYTTDPSEDW